MEIEKNYSIMFENFNEIYKFDGIKRNLLSFRVLKINYKLKKNLFNIEIHNEFKENHFFRYKFLSSKIFKIFSDLKMPASIEFYQKKFSFFKGKDEKKWDFSLTTVLEIKEKEKIYFYFSYPSLEILGKIKNFINSFILNDLKTANEIPKNLPIVFGEGSAGVLFHEAVSHPLEGDIFKECYYKNKIGERVSKEFLTVFDFPYYPKLPVLRKIDDEGEECQRKPLIEKGVLKNVLCNDFFSKELLFPPGNGWVAEENPIPLPRATNTVVDGIKGNNIKFNEIYSDFLYIPFIKDAKFFPPDFVFIKAGPVFFYFNKKLYKKIDYLTLEEKIENILSNVDFIGEKVERCLTFGTCIKNGGKLFVGAASPVVSFLNLSYKI